ncbi:MAG TPA: hypothetical protein VED59_08570, partial [Acidimicrobiales bacterium]|nr:hypothetical protein [Acidimicrobiales bacterium]
MSEVSEPSRPAGVPTGHPWLALEAAPARPAEMERPAWMANEVDRRTVLKMLGAGGLVVAVRPSLVGLARICRVMGSALRSDTSAPKPSLSVSVHRRDDLLDLQFDFYNLQLDSSGTKLVRLVASDPAYIVVVFPFQNVAEAAVDTAVTSVPPYPAPPLPALAPGPSQLAFMVPNTLPSVPFTMAGLLDWSALVPELMPIAVPVPKSSPQPPDPLKTFIELPWNLWLSPDANGSWHHSATPVTHGDWTELWQTRLGVGELEPPKAAPNIRAFWAPDYPQLGPDDPFGSPYALSLAAGDRRDLVRLSSGFVNADGVTVPGVPIPVKLFMLTGIGASTDFEGRWNSPFSSLTDWKHRMTTGRESYVRIVRSGYIFPFRHKAVLIKITDREFQVSPAGDVVAYLIQRKYVQVTQPTVSYEGASPEPWDGRENPLRQVTLKTLVTPRLDETGAGTVIAESGGVEQAIWVRSAGADVPFAISAVDFEGQGVDFTTSLIWVNSDDAQGY